MSPRYSDEQQRTILRALRIMEDKAKRRYTDTLFASPADTKQYFALRLAGLEREEFHVAFLDNRHRLIEVECLHQGSIAGSMVSPREVVKAALRHNAAAVLLAHNHPSGDPDPSKADRAITERLKDACALVDVRVLDHLVVGGDKVVSFAERGWL